MYVTLITGNILLNGLCFCSCRYFFKAASNEFGSDVILEEVTDDGAILPLWEGKVFGKVERIEWATWSSHNDSWNGHAGWRRNWANCISKYCDILSGLGPLGLWLDTTMPDWTEDARHCWGDWNGSADREKVLSETAMMGANTISDGHSFKGHPYPSKWEGAE